MTNTDHFYKLFSSSYSSVFHCLTLVDPFVSSRKKVCESFYFMYWRFYAPENTHYNLRKLCACVTQSYCFSSPIWTFLAPVIVLFDHQLHTHCFMISERVVKKYFKENWKIQTVRKFFGVRRGDVGSIFCLESV